MKTKYILDIQISDPILAIGIKQAIDQLDQFALPATTESPEVILTDAAQPATEQIEQTIRLVPQTRIRVGRLLQDVMTQQARAARQDVLPKILIGEMVFIPDDKKILPGGGQPAVALTDLETRLLMYFARHRGQTYSKDDLLKEVWEYQAGLTTHTVETHIYRLRQKLPLFERYLVTTDAGYMLK